MAIILAYNINFTTELGQGLKAAAAEQGLEVKSVLPTQLDETVGYLAGEPGFSSNGSKYLGIKPPIPFIVMARLSDSQLDNFLGAMKAHKAIIGHKAIMTNHNKNWKFRELLLEIMKEHASMK